MAEDQDAADGGFLATIARYRDFLGDGNDGTTPATTTTPPAGYRPLTSEEIRWMEAQGNAALGHEGWAGVFVGDFKTELTGMQPMLDRVRNCRFYGRVLLSGMFGGEVGVEEGMGPPWHPTGVYDSTLADCVVEMEALVKGCGLLSRVVVGEHAVVVGNGVVACKGEKEQGGTTAFGCGMEVCVGSEAQGRPVVVHPGARMERDVFPQALAQAYPEFDREAHLATLEAQGFWGPRCRSRYTIIGAGARVVGCPRVVDAFVGPGAVLANAEVEAATLLSSPAERTVVKEGAIVQRSILQWGVTVSGKAQVRGSLLMEHAHVEQEGKVNSSIACPDAGIATGECHHSLVGPFVGFHHQSLLIAALWPGGRGNVAYGAKVGSNHTGRAADQEAALGEGVFFGLGVLVKLPVNLLKSPYTLIAAGTSLEQQRLHFPFSLLAPCRDPALAPLHLNQLRPAWVLQHSPYTVVRNQDKFAKRSKARRHRTTAPVLRREVVALMLEARERLQTALEADPEATHFTEQTLPGLGANVATRKSAEEAVGTYTRWARRYALRGLLVRLLRKEKQGPQRSDSADAGTDDESDPRVLAAQLLLGPGASPAPAEEEEEEALLEWPYRRGLLQAQPGLFAEEGGVPIRELLAEAAEAEAGVAAAVEASKRKDDARGEGIIDDYHAARGPVEGDKVVRLAQAEAALVARAVARLAGSPAAALPLDAFV